MKAESPGAGRSRKVLMIVVGCLGGLLAAAGGARLGWYGYWEDVKVRYCDEAYAMVTQRRPVVGGSDRQCFFGCHAKTDSGRLEGDASLPRRTAECESTECVLRIWLRAHIGPDNPRNRHQALFPLEGEGIGDACRVRLAVDSVTGEVIVSQRPKSKAEPRSYRIMLEW